MVDRGRITRLVLLCVAALVAIVLVGAFAWAPATAKHESAPATNRCVPRLMQDWRDGRIDGTYPLPCYQAAIRDLPADMRVYSSAEDDIRQARPDRITQAAGRTLS